MNIADLLKDIPTPKNVAILDPVTKEDIDSYLEINSKLNKLIVLDSNVDSFRSLATHYIMNFTVQVFCAVDNQDDDFGESVGFDLYSIFVGGMGQNHSKATLETPLLQSYIGIDHYDAIILSSQHESQVKDFPGVFQKTKYVISTSDLSDETNDLLYTHGLRYSKRYTDMILYWR